MRPHSPAPPGSGSSPTASGRPEGWRPPPHSLEIRSIRERLRADTTWCAMALDAEGEPAGHVGITHAAERERPHVRIPGRAHLWMLFVRPRVVGERAGGAPAPARARGGRAPGLRDDPALHALRRRSRAGVLRARGLGARGPGVRRAAARAGPGRVPAKVSCTARAVIPEGLGGRGRALARLDATRLGRVRAGWRTMMQAAVACAASWAVAKWLWGHPAPFFAPVAAIIALGQSYYERGRRAVELVVAVTIGVAVADLLAYELGTGVPQLALAVAIAVGARHVLRDQPAVRQPGRDLGGAGVHDHAARRRLLVRARARRADRRADRAGRRRL